MLNAIVACVFLCGWQSGYDVPSLTRGTAQSTNKDNSSKDEAVVSAGQARNNANETEPVSPSDRDAACRSSANFSDSPDGREPEVPSPETQIVYDSGSKNRQLRSTGV